MDIGGRNMALDECAEGSIVTFPDKVGVRSGRGVWAGESAVK